MLELSDEDKTLVFDKDLLADQPTVAENYADITKNQTGKTSDVSGPPTDKIQPSPTFATDSPTKKGGFGFVTGFVIGILIIAVVGLGVVALIYLPSILEEDPYKTETIISDSSDVKISASSTRESESGNLYQPALAFDGNSRTAWSEGAKGAGVGQWIAFDFKDEVNLKEIIIEPGYFKTDELWQKNNRIATANFKFSDGTTKNVSFPDEMKEQKVEFNNVRTKSVMITVNDIHAGLSDSQDTLISEVKFIVD